MAMAFFFGLIAKEVVEATAPGGVLHPWRRAALPFVASLPAVLVPAALLPTVARAFDQKATDAIAAALSKTLAKTVVPHVTVDERILGGVVVRVGDRVMDGSVKRRLSKLRDSLVHSR